MSTPETLAALRDQRAQIEALHRMVVDLQMKVAMLQPMRDRAEIERLRLKLEMLELKQAPRAPWWSRFFRRRVETTGALSIASARGGELSDAGD